VLADPAHFGAVAGHTVVHPPQEAGLLISVSHPAVALPGQCIQPGAHDVGGTLQTPPLHVAGPLTWERAVQSWPHAPQFFESVCVSVHVPLHDVLADGGHEHPPSPAQVPQLPAWQTEVPPDPQGVPSARLAVFTHCPPSPLHVINPVWQSAGAHVAPGTHASPLPSAPIFASSVVASPCAVASGTDASPMSGVDPSAASDVDASFDASAVPGAFRLLIPRHPATDAATDSTTSAA